MPSLRRHAIIAVTRCYVTDELLIRRWLSLAMAALRRFAYAFSLVKPRHRHTLIAI